MLRPLKWLALLLAVASAGLALWRMVAVRPPQHPQSAAPAGPQASADRFRFTEVRDGRALYRLEAVRMEAGPGRIGPLRVAAMRVIELRDVQLSLLRPTLAGWVVRARRGRLVSGSRRLVLWGAVRGAGPRGGSFTAGRAEVDPVGGGIRLRDGYRLDAAGRHERGVATVFP